MSCYIVINGMNTHTHTHMYIYTSYRAYAILPWSEMGNMNADMRSVYIYTYVECNKGI